MPYHGSSTFEAYARTLRRVYWSDFLDGQMDHRENAMMAAAQQQPAEPRLAVYPLPNEPKKR